MNYGQRGRDLVSECKHGELLPYNDEAVRACLEEVTFHVDELTHLANSIDDDKPTLEVRPSLTLHQAAVLRNKRCLLAYHNYRVNAIKTDPSVPKSSLSEAEIDFLQSFERLRAEHSDKFRGLNLSKSKLPPTQTLIQVRVLQSLGKIVLSETGATVDLEKGTLHFLPAQDVEEFIQQGFLELVEGEEAF